MHFNVLNNIFTIAKIWKQPKCLSIDEWMEKMWCIHTHTVEYHSAIKKKKNFVICNNMDGLGGFYAK